MFNVNGRQEKQYNYILTLGNDGLRLCARVLLYLPWHRCSLPTLMSSIISTKNVFHYLYYLQELGRFKAKNTFQFHGPTLRTIPPSVWLALIYSSLFFSRPKF